MTLVDPFQVRIFCESLMVIQLQLLDSPAGTIN